MILLILMSLLLYHKIIERIWLARCFKKKERLRQNFAVYAATVNHNHITGNLVTVHFLDQDGNVLATATKHVPKSDNIQVAVDKLLDELGVKV